MPISVQDWCDDVGVAYRDLKVVARRTTRFNNIVLARSLTFGNILIINGEVQHVQSWEFLYHEPVVHLPMAFIPNPATVLILGGGSLNALRETLKYKSLKRVILAERDGQVVEIMARANPSVKLLLRRKGVEFIEGDAYEFVRSTKEKFDLIVNDALDLTQVQIGVNVMQLLQDRLTPVGVCSDLVYRHIMERKTGFLTLSLLAQAHRKVYSLVFVPEYPGFLHLLTLWGNNRWLSQSLSRSVNKDQRAWMARGRVPCKYYDPKCMPYYLYLPRYVRSLLRQITRTSA